MAGGLQFSAYVIVVLLISVTLLTHTGATLSKSDKNKKKEQKVIIILGPRVNNFMIAILFD